MIFYVNDKRYNISEEEFQKRYITKGLESYIYRFDNDIFKIYNDICFKSRLDKNSAKYLSQISTKRIQLPKNIIYDENHKFIGYTMPYIKHGNKDNINCLKGNKLLSELELIRQDLLILKENKVLIDDLCNSNFIFNKALYIIDPGSYEIKGCKEKDYIEILNREIMHYFLIKFILFREYKLSNNQLKKLNQHYPFNKYITDIISEEIKPKETLHEYSKRIINNL